MTYANESYEIKPNGTAYRTYTYYVPSPIETLKEDIRKIIIHGPPIKTINSVPVQGVVDELISRAREKGKKEYGTELETFNGRNALIDAAEEAFDLMQYCVQGHLESLKKDEEIAMLRQLVYDMRAEAVTKEMLRVEGMDETPRQVTQP